MFQYASAYACAYRMKAVLQLATDMFDDYRLHQGFELNDIFSISVPVCTANELKKVLGWRTMPSVRKLLSRYRQLSYLDGNAVFEPHFEYWVDLDNFISNKSYIHGYWQSERYFKNQAGLIRKEFQFRNAPDQLNSVVLHEIQKAPSASIHVRRGDYLNAKTATVHSLCSEEYYFKAIKLLQACIPGIRFFVFSDDVGWVKQVLVPHYKEMVVVDHNRKKNSFNDMLLMSKCEHHIIANSSFSWWGAWLNPNPDKIVIAPSKWFTNNKNSADIIPKEWMRI